MTAVRVSGVTFGVAMFAYLGGMVAYFHYMVFRRRPVWVVARASAIAGLGAQVVSITARGIAAGRVPWGNMYEYSTLLALLIVAAYLLVVEGVYKVNALGGFVLGLSLLTMAIAETAFYVPPAPLVPALQSYWIKIHVVAAITGSSLFALGAGLLTTLYLFQEARERRRGSQVQVQAEALVHPPIMGGSEDDPGSFRVGADEPMGEPVRSASGLLPPAATLDRMAYRVISFAFPIWTFAVIAGAIWAEQAWGRYWGWDPKETWSFITWVIFAGYLHARATAGWRGKAAAVLALVGFASLLVTYYVVNLWIVGLHSYKGF